MPPAYNSPTSTLDRPYSPGEFARYAETTGPNVLDETQYMQQPEAAPANFTNYPVLQVEAERQNANDLAMPADAHRGDVFVPPNQEASDFAAHIDAEAAALTGGVENMLSRSDAELSSAEINRRFDEIAANERARDAMAPNPEAQYRQGDEMLEAYNAGCAVMMVRRSVAPEAQYN